MPNSAENTVYTYIYTHIYTSLPSLLGTLPGIIKLFFHIKAHLKLLCSFFFLFYLWVPNFQNMLAWGLLLPDWHSRVTVWPWCSSSCLVVIVTLCAVTARTKANRNLTSVKTRLCFSPRWFKTHSEPWASSGPRLSSWPRSWHRSGTPRGCHSPSGPAPVPELHLD